MRKGTIMTNHEYNGEDELLAARRTAYALGQTEGAEAAEVTAELVTSEQARQEVEAIQALAARLKEAARTVRQPEPSTAIREAVERRLDELESVAGRAVEPTKARPWWRGRTAVFALTAACLAVLAISIVRPTRFLASGKVQEVAKRNMTQDNMIAPLPDRTPPTSATGPSLLESEYNDDSRVFAPSPIGRGRRLRGGPGANLVVPNPGGGQAEGWAYNRDAYSDGEGRSVGTGKGQGTTLTQQDAESLQERRVYVLKKDRTESNNPENAPHDSRARAGDNEARAATAIPIGAHDSRGRPGERYYAGTEINGGELTFAKKSAMSESQRQATDGQVVLGQLESLDVLVLRGSKADNDALGKALHGYPPVADQNSVSEKKPDTLRDLDGKEKKPIESWKPARVVPNTSRLMVGDREELPLKGMQVDVRVDGFRARVLLDLYYFNDRTQQLEGNFQLRLPDEASPYFFAFGRTVYQAPQITPSDSMFFKPQQVSQGDTTPEKILALRGNSWEQPKVARMVPKEKAALAYRDTVRRRVDPALLEWSGAGVFQCRVFPLAPQSLHRVTIGYDVDLLRIGDDLELRLDLPGQTPATVVDLNIAAGDARQVSLDAPATASADGQRLSYRLIDPKERPLAVRLRKPGMQMLIGNDEATGSYFATRVGLPLPETPAADRAKQAIFLVDTSLSAGPQFPLWTKLLRATLENNRDSIREFAVVFFNVETFWWQEKFVANTPENVDALLSYADGLALEGATDLGRALKEAASPAWLKAGKGSSPAADLFLLSDGATTWGEDRWALLASPLAPSVTPEKGEGKLNGQPGKTDVRSLFAYRTGLAGGDPRLLAYLAEQTGGAVFSLVGEAEIAAASVAHRNRPWRLTGMVLAGGHDLLLAGRPQYVFPGQQLLVVGRLEASGQWAADSGRGITSSHPASGLQSPAPLLVFTLQQGTATQTISVKVDQVLASELAARTFGQVATGQLEDVCDASVAAEPVPTAYARHFRVTGRTCSLLMLESEQDYARFNIKPEEDSFVVKDRPASSIVAKIMVETTAAMRDPKASFLAWYHRLRESGEVRFDLPASLDIALAGLPAEAFAVTAAPLHCTLRLRKDLPENFRQPWQSGLPDYETLAAEAQRRLTSCGVDDALRGLSSLVEDRPGDAALARDLAFSAIEWQRPGEAYHLLRRAAMARGFEPITFHAMAHCLEQMGRADLAIVYYELASGGQWDARFGDIHNIAQLDYFRFLRRVADGLEKVSLAEYAKARLATLAATQLRDTADVAALLFWNTDGTDVDLHVIEPSGEECFYQHTQTASGGHISRDVTTGYGPELYLLPKAPPGNYRISAHYYAADANRASTRTKVLALIYQGWGTKDEKVTVKALALNGRSESHELAEIKRKP